MWLQDASAPLDSTAQRGIFHFEVGAGTVITCLDLAARSMQLGEMCHVVAAPQHAFGKLGLQLGVTVPPNATLKLKIELVDATPGTQHATVPASERLTAATAAKDQGNKHVSKSDFQQARDCYHEALHVIGDAALDPVEDGAKFRTLRGQLWSNLALCELKLHNFSKAIFSCEKALSYDPSNVKAMFRKGQALEYSGELRAARDQYTSTYKLSPTAEVKTALDGVKNKLAASSGGLRGMFDS
jgi:tetratricopeptide (TPR) repeat protein